MASCFCRIALLEAQRRVRPVPACRLASFVFQQNKRSFVSASSILLEKKTMKVPTMGDSITEGTIVEWTAQVGQAVSEGDVVAMVETDKVTVEIKAEVGGVITSHFGKVDETVEVGGNLYEIDTDAEAASSSASIVSSDANESKQPDEKAPASTGEIEAASVGKSVHRTPSIQFLGKEGWARMKNMSASTELPPAPVSAAVPQPPKAAAPSTTTTTTSPWKATSIIVSDFPPMYGRPKFTEEEMEALVLGGASIAPQVIAPSSGAKFK